MNSVESYSLSDRLWLAGFFDGEGYAQCRKKKQSYNRGTFWYLQAVIGQKERYVLRQIKRIVGGGSLRRYVTKGNSIWHFTLGSRQARHFLIQIAPYLRSKHKQTQVQKALSQDRIHVRAQTS